MNLIFKSILLIELLFILSACSDLNNPDKENKVFSSYESGIYDHEILVTLTTDLEDAIIYYTTDGTEPNPESAVYADGFRLYTTSQFNLKVKAVNFSKSTETFSFSYIMDIHAGNPIITPDDQISYSMPVLVDFKTNDDWANVYYSLDGSNPGNSATTFRGNYVLLSESTLVRAICSRPLGVDFSEIIDKNYIVDFTPPTDKVLFVFDDIEFEYSVGGGINNVIECINTCPYTLNEYTLRAADTVENFNQSHSMIQVELKRKNADVNYPYDYIITYYDQNGESLEFLANDSPASYSDTDFNYDHGEMFYFSISDDRNRIGFSLPGNVTLTSGEHTLKMLRFSSANKYVDIH